MDRNFPSNVVHMVSLLALPVWTTRNDCRTQTCSSLWGTPYFWVTFIHFSIDSRCLLQIGDESPDICICCLSSNPPVIYMWVSVYVYVHISLFLPECACTTIIDISSRIFSLMYCCCVSIIIVVCICSPVTLIWLINLFLLLFLF